MPSQEASNLTIILPAKNESDNLKALLPELRNNYPKADIIVVDDGSSDDTTEVCEQFSVTVLSHPYSIGNGAAIKTGARNARSNTLVLMDADGQHPVNDVVRLLDRYNQGFDMVVGARSQSSQAGKRRRFGNRLYNRIASLITGHRIDDLTSGFRVVQTEKFREFLHLLPNGFSYPTTITMAFFRNGYSVAYVPIHARQRTGKSHIKLLRDGLRFLLIIFRVGTLYSPLKVFVPVSAFFFLFGLGYYAFTYITQERFTNMSALLLMTSVIIFMIGLVSEQITNLMYMK